jgi:hypothetical protein
MAEMTEIVWEQVGLMPDCAFAALGDPSLLGDDAWVGKGFPSLQRRSSGLGMLYGQAECDGLPVELGRLSAEIVGARLEFTNDVAKLERSGAGHWSSVGRLRIGRRGGVALDAKMPNKAEWCHKLPLPGVWYQAEAFEYRGDHLGIRLIAKRLAVGAIRSARLAGNLDSAALKGRPRRRLTKNQTANAKYQLDMGPYRAGFDLRSRRPD